MNEVSYNSIDIRYVARKFVQIPLTFNGGYDIPVGAIIGLKNGTIETIKREAIAANIASATKEITLKDVSKFKIGDVVSLVREDGTGVQSLGAIVNIDVQGKKITVTNDVGAAFNVGSFLFVADGSEKAIGVLSEPAIGNGEVQTINAYIEGVFDATLISGIDKIALKDLNGRVINNILVF